MKMLINPIIRTRTRYFRHAYHPTHDILVSEVGGSDRIGFTSSGHDRKYVTILCHQSRSHELVTLLSSGMWHHIVR
jgi:hypothetical protein